MPKEFIWRNRLAISVTIALLIVLTIVVVSYRNTAASIAATRWVTHTHDVVLTIEQTLSHVEAAESAQRGYVLSGRESFANETRNAHRVVTDDLNRLRELVADNPAEARRVNDLAAAIDAKLRFIDSVVATRKTAGFAPARDVVAAGGGVQLMNAVQQRARAMLDVERNLLAQRTARSEEQGRRTMAVLWGGSIIDLILVAVIVMLVLRDFGRRSELHRALALARDSALQSAELRSQFLANMSHEIRTPLNAIIGMSGLLVATKLDEDQRELAETVRTSADALLTIINDILDFSKIEAGKLLIEEVEFELRPAVEGVIDLFSEAAQAKDVEIGALFDHDVPTLLRGDAGRIRQVLTNLVGNAVKFTSSGEVIVQTNVIRREDDVVHVRFSVTDTGIGMSDDVMSRLFQPFSQADASTTRQYGGTGLGLAISKQLVELMGGTIDVDSAPGKGSTFWFTLPLGRVEERDEAYERLDLHGVRILVVDDNQTHRRLLHNSIEAWRMESDEVESGLQALARLREAAQAAEPFAVALIDMFMPEMDGMLLARTIKSDPDIASTHLILVTSMADRMDQKLMREAGFEASLTKPVKQSALFDVIVNAIAARRQVKRVEDPAAAAPLTVHANARVLVAEDNPVNQKLAIRQLKRLGIVADPVSNGAEAVEALNRIPYDLVLMDCQMPEMDGFEATRQIREREGHLKHTPVVALTANALQGDRERCLDAGMDDYLAKPVSERDLARVLQKWLPAAEKLVIPIPDAIEPKTIAYLRQLGGSDQDFLRDLIALYIDDAGQRINAIRAAIAANDASELASAAHGLKSSAGNVGAMAVRSVAETLEKIGRAGSIDGAQAHAAELEAEHVRAVECLRTYES